MGEQYLALVESMHLAESALDKFGASCDDDSTSTEDKKSPLMIERLKG
jgi:hypothetical protein